MNQDLIMWFVGVVVALALSVVIVRNLRRKSQAKRSMPSLQTKMSDSPLNLTHWVEASAKSGCSQSLMNTGVGAIIQSLT